MKEQREQEEQSQQEYLRALKVQLKVTWDELAARAGITPRAMKTYRMPVSSKDFREMPHLAWLSLRRLEMDAEKPVDIVRTAYHT